MNPTLQKLTQEIATDLRARVKSLDFKTIEKIRKAKDENGTFDVIISTEDLDRSGEIVRQNGWEMQNYKNNPIVLWGHDYYSLPIGVCTETYKTEYHGLPATGARGVFYPADINPLAQQVRRMYDFGIKTGMGVGTTTSVGFIPKEFDENNQRIITRAELLEFSFVPVPANQGVGPAEGRAFTFEEAKELDLDVAELRVKGMTFTEVEEKAEEVKTAQAGDDCTMDDGGAGVLATDPNDPDGALVCSPAEQKSADTSKPLQKKLIKAVGDEHDRHVGEVEQSLDTFSKSVTDEEQGDEKSATLTEAFKDLRDSMRDEHDMHRAKSLASFRGFDPAEDKAFDKKPHIKALREEHDAYEAKCMKAIDDLQTRCEKSLKGESDDHADWITGKLDEAQRAHKKAVTKLAKTMCKAAFGEEDEPDEKVLEILKDFLSPFVPQEMQTAVFMKVGARISAATKEKLSEAHQHIEAASAIVKALHGGLGNDEGEESRSVEGTTSSVTAPVRQRSRPTESASAQDDLKAHLDAREIVREITTVAQRGLAELNKRPKK